MGVRRGERRVPLREASELLGVSKDAVRQRIRRKTLRADKGEDGKVYVYLDASVYDVHPDAAGDQGRARGSDHPDLVDELRDRVRYLEGIVATRDEEIRRRDVIISQLTERIPPAIEAPSEARKSPQTVEEEPERAEPHPATVESQEPIQRPWWRRAFGG